MNNLKNFIDSNSVCPVCNNNLSLYLQLIDNAACQCFDAYNNRLIFKQNDDKIIIDFNNNSFQHSLNRNYDLFLFYICNKEAVPQNVNDEIQVYDACYYKASNFYSFQKENDKFILIRNPLDNTSTLREEVFTISNIVDDQEKVYILNSKFDSFGNKQILYYYSIDKTKENDDNYNPSVFEKTFKNFTYDLTNKQNLINRFENIITVA